MRKTSHPSILIVDPMHESLVKKLDASGLDYQYFPNVSKEEIPMMLPRFEGLVIRSKMHLSADILPFAKNLKLIVRAGSGMDNVDTALFESKGISCVNCPEGNRDAVAEHAVGMLLSLSANIVKGNSETSNYVWDREGNRGFEIKGKTVGIIGYGNTGSAFAEKLQGFGCSIIAYDKYRHGFGSSLVREVCLEEMYHEADVISFHIPLTSETKNWISRSFFERLAKPIVLLNLSRGGIMNTSDVIRAVRNNQIKAVGLDVLENENLKSWSEEERAQFDELKSFKNVIVTPHVGGWSTESYQRISEIAANKIIGHFEKSIPFVKDEDNISDNT